MNTPMLLTLSRFILAPLFAGLFVAGYGQQMNTPLLVASLIVCIAIEVTDFLDGHIARARNLVTNMGKIFDPITDVVAKQTAFVVFTIEGIIPFWFLLVIIYRAALIYGLRIFCAKQGTVLAARMTGKINTASLGAAILAVHLIALARGAGYSWASAPFAGQPPAFWVLLVPTITTALSAIEYFVANRSVVRDMLAPVSSST